jgi:outer membrane biosynthesis protein TonB
MDKCRENTAPRPLSRLDFMARPSAFLIALALGAAAALGLVACGGGGNGDLLPGGTAGEINANLDQVEQLASEGDCAGAGEAAQAVSSQVEALGGVDAKLKQALSEGATRLNEVVAGCEEASVEEETVPSVAPAEEPEEEKKEKPEKPEKPKQEKEEPEETTTPTLPPQAEGKAKGHEKQEEEAPPVESGGGTPSGGVGPGTPAEGD